MFVRAFLTCCALSFPFLATLAQQENTNSFATLLEKLKQADPKFDFKALRFAYTETPMYNPYAPARELQAAVLKALSEKKYEQCLEHVEKALQKNYVDSNVHFAAMRCHIELKNQEKAKYHHYVLDGLIKSILASGDGKSPASAFLVISTEEEYALLDAVGLRRVSQALVKENGRTFDLITAREEKTDKEYRLYFNIDRQFEWLRKSFNKDNK